MCEFLDKMWIFVPVWKLMAMKTEKVIFEVVLVGISKG